MIKPKLQRFATATNFSCPLCQEKLNLVEQSLRCPQHHSFDIAKFGYVNLAPQVKQAKDYDRENFENRKIILDAGFYDHILEEINRIVQESQAQTLLDVGCGEGYYSRQLQERFPEKDFYAFDLSKHSIQLAAKSEPNWQVKWFVGDLAHLPIQDQSMDFLLDIFSPANYSEFARVLKKEGILVKVVPTSQHLVQVRELVQEQLQKKDYHNDTILDHFQQHCQLLSSQTLSKTHVLNPEQKKALLAMTPLLFHVDQKQIDWDQLTQVTIEATLLVGKIKL